MKDLTPLSERTSLTEKEKSTFKDAVSDQKWLLNAEIRSAGRAGKGFVGDAKNNQSEKMKAAFQKFDSALTA